MQDMHMLLQGSQASSSSSWGGSLTNSHHLSVPPQPPPRFIFSSNQNVVWLLINLCTSVVNPIPVGSGTFSWIRIRNYLFRIWIQAKI